jgi:hypothetical protein
MCHAIILFFFTCKKGACQELAPERQKGGKDGRNMPKRRGARLARGNKFQHFRDRTAELDHLTGRYLPHMCAGQLSGYNKRRGKTLTDLGKESFKVEIAGYPGRMGIEIIRGLVATDEFDILQRHVRTQVKDPDTMRSVILLIWEIL